MLVLGILEATEHVVTPFTSIGLVARPFTALADDVGKIPKIAEKRETHFKSVLNVLENASENRIG